MDREIRIFAGGLEVRSASDSGKSIRGYAAKFGVLSENLGGFREQLRAGAFSDVLQDDVRALINHDPNLILGRTTSGTARIGEDSEGLWYEVDLPDTQAARDLMESIKRGDVNQSSFAFSIAPGGDSWAEDPNTGAIVRTVDKVGRLYDVSPVTYPAYPDATVGVRSLEQHRKSQEQRQKDAQAAKRRIDEKRRERDMIARRIPKN